MNFQNWRFYFDFYLW